MLKRPLLIAALALLPLSAMAEAPAKEPIKIGEMMCYTACANTAQSWRNGWQMAQAEINARGGILGRPLEVLSRDDKGDPAETTKVFEDLKNRNDVKIFFGTLYDHSGLAGISYAKQNHVLFVRAFGGSDKMTGQAGHNLFFQIQPRTAISMGALAEKAAASGKKRWAIIAPDYEFGHATVDTFKENLKRLNPDVAFVETQWFPIGKLNAGVVAQVIEHAKPDGLFINVFEGDYSRLVREGTKRKLFDGRFVVAPVAGYPGYIRPLGKEAPQGWVSAYGYPIEQLTDQAHKAFVETYRKQHETMPDFGAVLGYSTLNLLAEAINKAGEVNPEKVAAILHKETFQTIDGPLSFRADGISSRGDWIGTTGFFEGMPTILNPEYIKPDKYLPTVEENMKRREGNKN